MKEFTELPANSPMPRLVELKCHLNHIKSLPLFLGHFPNLKELDIDCYGVKEEVIDDLVRHLEKTQITTIKFKRMSHQNFLHLSRLSVKRLQVCHIEISESFAANGYYAYDDFYYLGIRAGLPENVVKEEIQFFLKSQNP